MPSRESGSPLRVALHRPTLRTRNTAWGSHHSSNTSSGENTGALELEAAGASASARIELLICTLAGAAVSMERGTRWKA